MSKILLTSLFAVSIFVTTQPVWSSNDDDPKRPSVPASKKKGWVEVTSHRAQRGPKPNDNLNKPAIRQAPVATKASDKREEALQTWQDIKSKLLAGVEATLVSKAELLLEKLRPLHKYGIIKKIFPESLLLLRYAEPTYTIQQHMRVFSELCQLNEPRKKKNGMAYPRHLNDLLGPIPEQNRRGIVAGFMVDLCSEKFGIIDREYYGLYKTFKPASAMDVLELAVGRASTKLLNRYKFADAFNQLMEILYCGPVLRTPQSAEAHLVQVKALAKLVEPETLKLEEYTNVALAMEYLLQSEGFVVAPDIFNELVSACDTQISNRYQSWGRDEQLKKKLLFKLIKICGLNSKFMTYKYNVSRFMSAAFSESKEPRFADLDEVLGFLIANRDVWIVADERQFGLRFHKMLSLLMGARKQGLGQKFWSTMMTDAIRLDHVQDLAERFRRRVEGLGTISEKIRQQLAPGIWKLFVQEQPPVVYSFRQDTPGQFTMHVIDLLKQFKEDDMRAAMVCINRIFAIESEEKPSYDEMINRIHQALISMAQEKRLSFLALLTETLARHPDRLSDYDCYLDFLPYFGQGDLLERFVVAGKRGTRSNAGIIVWYNTTPADVQLAVHDYWESELQVPGKNRELESLIIAIGENLPDSLKDLLAVLRLRERKKYMESMDSEDLRTARQAAEYVINNPSRLGIIDPDNDEVYQHAIIILSKTSNSMDPLNPYNVMKHHLEMAKEVVDYTVIKSPEVNGYYVQGDVFKGIRVNQVTFAQLPEHSKTYLRDMQARILKKQPDWNGTFLGAGYGGFLEATLAIKGGQLEIVPPVNAKLIAIVAHLQGLPDKDLNANGLTEQEAEFVRFMCQAQDCETNKTEVIHKFYTSLPQASRLPLLKTGEDSSEEYLRLKLAAPFMDMLEDIFSAEKPFMRTLCGLEKGQYLGNSSHIECFFKNLLIEDLPLCLRPTFDRYTRNCLQESLLAYRRGAVLTLLFTQFIKPNAMAKIAHGAINTELRTPKSAMVTRIQEFFEKHQLKAGLEFDEDTKITSISEKSVWELLYLLKFFKLAGSDQ